MYKVLIVEDDPMVAMINEQYVKRNKQFQVIASCQDGERAISYLEQHEVDLVVLDVYMPKMNGFEVLRKMRSKLIMVDAIMVTAANDRESLEEALRLGIIDYLVKPFTFERFQMALEKYIAKTKAFEQLHILNQTNIDHIMDHTRKKSEELYPKGIQEKTLHVILEELKKHPAEWMTGEKIAELTALTSVTVRRYLNYLAEAGTVVGEMNYDTGGRPCMMYKL